MSIPLTPSLSNTLDGFKDVVQLPLWSRVESGQTGTGVLRSTIV